ncbi:MAG: PEP-CTERM sorting domain-containing protein, partial [Thermoguttaceae bacterium]|nr:PEP-CTERM sorting domain-containing protein [Thermoguttaceae bacterium]
FDMEKIDVGVFELTLGEGLTADDGYLLLGLAGDETGANSQGILSYEATEDGTFLINVFSAMADSTLTDQDFMFAFFANDGSFQTQVPEPASVVLLLLGACGLWVLRKKK